MWIYETWERLKPAHSLEIGLAYGFSTVYILAAMAETGNGHHTAIHPFQRSYWNGVGALQATHFKLENSFDLVEEPSSWALPRFAAESCQFELIFIDGNHRFDDVLVDFTLSAEICPQGGEVIFDDMWMPSIQTVVHWIRSNRPDFREVHTLVGNTAHFQRIGKDKRDWRHFVPFKVRRNGPANRLLGSLPTPVKRMLRL